MTTDCARYLNQFSIWGAAKYDQGNTENIKSTNPFNDRFMFHDHKHNPLPPNSRYLSPNPATYLL